jgi:hypothetical protein
MIVADAWGDGIGDVKCWDVPITQWVIWSLGHVTNTSDMGHPNI